MKPRRLSGSGGRKSYHRTSDNLFSTDIVEVLLGVSEGPIKGLANGPQSFLIDDTPLQSPDGENNFDEFELHIREGSEEGEEIVSRMGGFGSSITVNTELETNTPVVRQGQQTKIDYIDIRLVVNRLYREDDQGNYEHSGQVRIEYKRTSESVWHNAQTNSMDPPPSLANLWYGLTSIAKTSPSPGDRYVYWQNSPPTGNIDSNSLWFDKDNDNRPYRRVNDVWQQISATKSAQPITNLIYWSWTETDAQGRQKTVRAFISPTLHPSSPNQGDVWLKENSALIFNGSTWINAGSSFTRWNPLPGGNGIVTIKGKTTAPYVKELRIPVNRIDDDTYMVRVTKLSPPNTTKQFFDIVWESFQEVKAQTFQFPGLATTQLVARASEQFSSIPQFSGIYEGRIVRVPSNYDPEARTYNGVWDGTWKLAYTNNPAFVLYDLVMNNRYGMNAYYPIELNKWDVYDAGQWCDQRRADGKPRFTFNHLIQDPMGGREAIDYVAGVFGGRFFDDGNGFGTIKIDRDTEPVAIFSPENVEDGLFVYSFTEISSRYNDITVTFINPDLNWAEDRRRIYDQDHIDRYGRIPLNFIAVGCIDEAEAIARARYKLITGISEKRIVNFKTNRQGLYLSPYDVVLIADDEMAGGLHGRVYEVTGEDSFSLREPLFLEPGYNYRVVFQLIDPESGQFRVYKYDLAQGLSGTITDVVVDGTLPELPEKAVFAIETTDGKDAPRAFRITSITEVDGDPDKVEITAVEINRAKWAYVDGHVYNPSETIIEYEVRSKHKPAPVPSATVRPIRTQRAGKDVVDLILEWEPSPSTLVQKYRVLVSRNGNPPYMLAELSALTFEWKEVPPGEYVFSIVAVTAYNRESEPLLIEHRLVGDYRALDPVTGLRLLDEPLDDIYERLSPTLIWDASTHPDFKSYVVQIYNMDGDLLRQVNVQDPTFTYEYTVNKTDNGGTPARMVKVSVAVMDYYGALSPFTELVINNPPPEKVTGVELQQVFNSIVVSFSPVENRDLEGYVVHVSTTPGFVPGPSTLKYQGKSNSVNIPVDPGYVYYVKVAAYDVFGTTGLNFSDEVSINTQTPWVDTEPPAIPTGLTLTSQEIATDPGYVELKATWSAVADDDLAYYEVQLKEEDGVWVSFQTSSTEHVWRVRPARSFQARVIAVDTSGNKSNPSTVVSHTTLADTTPPAVPTNVTATAGLDAIWLKWTSPSDADLSHIEVWENSTNNIGSAAHIGNVTGDTLARTGLDIETTRYYWLRSVDTSGNKSSFTSVVSATTRSIPDVDLPTINGVTFQPVGNKITWTSGSITYNGGTETRTVAAGETTWSSGTIYIYYIRGQTVLSTTGSLATVYSNKGILLGIYKGGKDFQLVEGKAYIDGGMILSQTIGANQLVTDQAVITGTAQIKDAIITDAKITELSAAKLKAGTAMAGSITVDGRTMGSIAENYVFFDDMRQQNWVRVIGNGAFHFNTTDNRIETGSSMLVKDPDGQVAWLVSPEKIAFDPTKLYRITFRVRRGSGTEGQLYLGLMGYAADKTTRVNTSGQNTHASQHYVVASGLAQSSVPSDQWGIYVGYVKGKASIGSSIAKPNLSDPAVLHENVRYISPYVIANYGTINDGVGAEILVDSVKIEVVDEDAASVINAGTTQIDPGKIRISGSTTLADWRKAGDETRIDGGNISANTIQANALTIGQRGITVEDITFEHNSPNTNYVSWTAGTIRYVGDNGNIQSQSISAGSAQFTSGTLYIFWVKGATSLSTTTSTATAFQSDRVVLAVYRGAANLITDYGRTIIDGSHIKTGTVKAEQIASLAIKAEHLESASIEARHIKSQTITTDHLGAQTVTADKLAAGAIKAEHIDANKIDAAQVLQNGTLITDLIKDSAVSDIAVTSISGTITNQGEFTIASASVEVPIYTKVLILFYAEVVSPNARIRLRIKRGSTILATRILEPVEWREYKNGGDTEIIHYDVNWSGTLAACEITPVSNPLYSVTIENILGGILNQWSTARNRFIALVGIKR